MNIYKIAQLAGVSPATVSKVINGKDDIGEETRTRILKIIEDNHFIPKVSTSNMDTIAIFAPIGKELQLGNPYFSLILSGVGDIAYDNDFGLTIVSSSRIPKGKQEFLRYCRQRKIVGGIFSFLTVDDRYIINIANEFPSVILSHRFEGHPIGSVQTDNFNGAYEAIKYLISCGHKNIMFIIPGMQHMDHRMRSKGGEKALEEANFVKNADSIDDSINMSDTDLGYYLKQVMEKENRPTAIFAANDMEALRIMKILQDNHMNIPEDISIIGFDDNYFAAHTNPPLTTVFQPIYEVGQEACRMLIGMINNGEKQADTHIMLKTKLMIRKSVKKMNDKA